MKILKWLSVPCFVAGPLISFVGCVKLRLDLIGAGLAFAGVFDGRDE